jgi:starch synthase
MYTGTRSLFTIHNLGYQGLFPASAVPLTGLPGPDFFHPEGMEFWGNLSLLKAGIVYADLISTVSPTYAREIQTPEQGMGMDGILYHRRDALHGILNGVDYRVWDPSLDPHLPARYSAREPAGKGLCKEALIREMGLDLSLSGRPLLGIVSRLDAQKGLDLLMKIMPDILALDVGLVVLGAGDEKMVKALREAAEALPGQMAVSTGFNEPLAHRILAGADIFLIPSRYEPCGLTQMYALKYGTVPLVRATGGLEDTIVSFDRRSKEGNGVKFGPYDPDAFLSAVRQALALYDDRETWERLMFNGMREDFSWDHSAGQYLELFKSKVNE